ncbi:MAG: hypothetical protein ACRDWT_09605 [Jatrophihabitantaceae bacterium]
MTARLTSINSVSGKADGPGEIAGPAVAITVALHNGTNRTLALVAVMNLYYGSKRTPAVELAGSQTQPLPSSIGPQKTISGVYTFTIATADRRDVLIEFSYSGSSSVVLFKGGIS